MGQNRETLIFSAIVFFLSLTPTAPEEDMCCIFFCTDAIQAMTAMRSFQWGKKRMHIFFSRINFFEWRHDL